MAYNSEKVIMKRKEIIELALEKGYTNPQGTPYTREQIERLRGDRWNKLVEWLGVEYDRISSVPATSPAGGMYIPLSILVYLDIEKAVNDRVSDIEDIINSAMANTQAQYNPYTGKIEIQISDDVKALQKEGAELIQLRDRIKVVKAKAEAEKAKAEAE